MKLRQWALGLLLSSAATGIRAQGSEIDQGTLRTVGLVTAITGQIGQAPVLGAGIVFAVEKDKLYIATAGHVVRRSGIDAHNLQVQLRDWPDTHLPAKLLPQEDREFDVAVLVVENLAAKGVDPCALSLDRLARPGAARRGVLAVPIGNPNGVPWTVPVGRDPILEERRSQVIFESARIARGHSGGALVGAGGTLFGMLQADEPPNVRALSIGKLIEILQGWKLPVHLSVPGEKGASALFDAVRKDDLASAKELIGRACVNVNQPADPATGLTILTEAAKDAGAAMVDLLLQAGAEVNPRLGDSTPIEYAARRGNLAMARALIARGAELNLSNGQPRGLPLGAAAGSGRLEMVKLLLANGADPNLPGRTEPALSAAASVHRQDPAAHIEMLRTLLQAGANANWKDVNGIAALTHEVEAGEPGAVKLLLESGADPAVEDHNHYSLFKVIEGYGARHNPAAHQILLILLPAVSTISQRDIGPLLDQCVKEDWADVASLILPRGFDVKGEVANQSLLEAAEIGHPKIMRVLLDAGTDPEAGGHARMVPSYDTPKQTPLERALGGGRGLPYNPMDPAVRFEVVQLLVSKGAKVNLMPADRLHLQPIWRAVINVRDFAIAQFLLAHGATVTAAMIEQARRDQREDAVAWFLKARPAPSKK